MQSFLADIRHSLRAILRKPGFALAAVATLALGIGASTAIFSVTNAVLLRPLPYADAERLVLVWGDMRNRNVTDFPFPPADFQDLRERGTLFEGFAGLNTFPLALTVNGTDPEQIRAANVTTNFFTLLGGRVAIGRNFSEADGTPQPPPPQNDAVQGGQVQAPPQQQLPTIAIISHAFWRRRFGGDSSILGGNIELGNNIAQVVGILAPEFEILYPPGTNVERVPDVYTAMRVNFAAGSRVNVFLRVVARLKSGVTVQQAQAQVDGIAADLRRQFPIKETAGVHFRLEPMHTDLIADVKPAIVALMGAVIFVLLISCANVANLLLVRASWRERELAARAALGSTRWRLVRQMLAESALLAAMGALAGVALAWLGIRLLVAIAPPTLPRLDAVQLDVSVLLFTALVSVLAAALFGIIPALRASRTNVADALRASGRTPGLNAGKLLRNSVVVGEVALSFVLLIGSGLMFRSFIELQKVDPGYDASNVLTFRAANPRANGEEGRAAFARDVRSRLSGLPGVQSIAAANPLPLDGTTSNARWGTQEAVTNPAAFQQATVHFVLPGYFETMRSRLVEGRYFTEADNRADANYIIIDDLLKAKAFPNESAVGKRLLVRVRTNEPEWLEVLGVVQHQRHNTLYGETREGMFFTDGFINHGAATHWAVRTERDPMDIANAVRSEIAALAPLVAVAEMQPMQKFVTEAMAPTRFALVLIGVFAGIAALLASIGLYGVLSTVVRLRTAEIGVRMAFGAPGASIFRMVIGEGMKLSAIGVLVGVGTALALTRVMQSMLVGVTATDAVTYVGIGALFFVIAFIACWIPAARAARMQPTWALREE